MADEPNFYSARRYYPMHDRCDRKRCQHVPAGRRRCGRCHSSSGRTGAAGGMPHARRLSDWRRAYRLPCRYVIHTPGPIWRGGHAGEAVLLAGCYQNCLRIASELNCKTVAFPSISTGVYRFPLNRAAEIAIRTIEEYLSTHAEIEQVSMICFDGTTLSAYQNALSEREANHV